MEKYLTSDIVIALGDTHSLYFLPKLKKQNLRNFILIHVGDAGEGFSHMNKDRLELDGLQRYLEKTNGKVLIVRGNHSDPAFYKDGHWSETYKNIEFVKDYTYKIINDKTYLFAGGAVSVDRFERIPTVDYWEDEGFILHENYNDLAKCDVLVTHSSPLGFYPVGGFDALEPLFLIDPSLKGELIEERDKLLRLYNVVQPKILVNGHFHESNVEYVPIHCLHRTLDIDEFWEIRL